METLAGKTGLEILANGGIDERFIGSLTAPPFNARFSPVIESLAVLEGIGAVPLYGVDLTGAPGNAIVPSRALAQRLHLAVDAPLAVVLAGRRSEFQVARIAGAASAEFLAIDIAAAQQALGRYGKLDRIDITVSPGEDFARVEQAGRAALPPACLIEKPGARSQENQRMFRAFR